MQGIASVASKKKIIFVHLNVHGKVGTNSSSRSLPQSMNAFTLTFMLCERRSERRSKNARSPILWLWRSSLYDQRDYKVLRDILGQQKIVYDAAIIGRVCWKTSTATMSSVFTRAKDLDGVGIIPMPSLSARVAWRLPSTEPCSPFGALSSLHWCLAVIWGPWKRLMRRTRSEIVKITPNFVRTKVSITKTLFRLLPSRHT